MIPSAAELAYFTEVAGTLNVSRAAERLGISQPSLSAALKKLERSVGAPLLIRSKRGVVLTQAGRQLLAHSKSLLQSWEEIRARAQASLHEIQGTYTIGCHPSMAMRTLSAFLPKMIEEYPKLDIRIHHDISRRITEDIISMKVDIGIVVNPVRHPDLVIHRLGTDKVTFWTAAEVKSSTQDLAREGAVLVCDPDLRMVPILLKKYRERGVEFSRTITSGSLEVVGDLVANGCGVGILPSRVASRALRRLKPISGAPTFHDDHCLLYRVENKGVRAVQALSRAIRDSVKMAC